jgi:outer membrane PBP1 activator LpoA protein
MQRISFFVFGLAALYGSHSALATPQAAILAKPVAAKQEVPASASAVAALPILQPDNPAPHLALLLPLKAKSPELAHAAELVQQGFQAAASVQAGLPLRIYPCTDEASEIVTLYRQALLNGAQAVAGPLTRNGVSALAAYPDITLPTLALNVADAAHAAPNLYFFGLPSEQEARQAAQLATMAKLKYATIISTGTPLSKRLAAAFSEEWRRQGGTITADVLFNAHQLADLANLPVAPWAKGTKPPTPVLYSETGERIVPNRPQPQAIAPGNVVFLATDYVNARLIRPYLNPNLPVYATSLLFKGNNNKLSNFDLGDINFVDMPWLLQPDHPAVMIYPRAAVALDAEMERLYALGIDSYRLLNILLSHHLATELPLDGVTGQVRLQKQQFVRLPMPAFFKQGLGLTEETLAALNAAKASSAVPAVKTAN